MNLQRKALQTKSSERKTSKALLQTKLDRAFARRLAFLLAADPVRHFPDGFDGLRLRRGIDQGV